MNVAIQDRAHGQPMLVAMRSWFSSFWRHVGTSGKVRRLRLSESLSLGEKRFVAVVEFETQRFLIGGGAQSVNLLARLGEGADFAEVLTEWCERQR
jgi:flagellar biogenesis protein FliO